MYVYVVLYVYIERLLCIRFQIPKLYIIYKQYIRYIQSGFNKQRILTYSIIYANIFSLIKMSVNSSNYIY